MAELMILIGLPGSGKSTWAKSIEHEEYKIVSSDSYREKISGDESVQGNNNELFETIHKDIIDFLLNGKSVIFDATNLNYKKRMELIKKVNSKVSDVYIIAEVFATQYSICIAQNKKRERQVPEFVIKRMRESFNFPQYWEGFHDIFIKYDYDSYDYRNEYLEEQMKNFNQDNPHHTGTLGEHTLKVFFNVMNVVPENFRIQLAAFYHDIGKLHTKSYKDSKGNRIDFAHYYNHENVSAYESMFYLKERGVQEFDIFYAIGLIQLHMRPYGINTEKSKEKLINLIGSKMYDDLMILNDADRKGK